ncbi:MAG: response regulator [Hyphomonadaceae bacterium]|nr:response regulator [Hyphomonadaceae bacterium]
MTAIGDMHVLIVDDNAQMRALLRALLRAGGFLFISEAETAEAGVRIIGRARADLIILDWKMAPIDGLAFTRLLRNGETDANPCTPILMLTAHTEGSRVTAARDAGVTGFLKKPISAQNLLDRVAAALTDTRLFVRSADFFGPDRRRGQALRYVGPLRRCTDGAETLDLDDIRLIA